MITADQIRDVLANIRSSLMIEQVQDLNDRVHVDSGVKVACEIVLGVRPGCEAALSAATDVVVAAIACRYGGL